MWWYLTIRADPNYSRAVETDALVEFLRSLPELIQTETNTFSNAPGQPWVSLTLADSRDGSYADHGERHPFVNLVDVVCSDEYDGGWYDALAARIAAFLGWEALEATADRTVRQAG